MPFSFNTTGSGSYRITSQHEVKSTAKQTTRAQRQSLQFIKYGGGQRQPEILTGPPEQEDLQPELECKYVYFHYV